jgi:hypothetical protein
MMTMSINCDNYDKYDKVIHTCGSNRTNRKISFNILTNINPSHNMEITIQEHKR